MIPPENDQDDVIAADESEGVSDVTPEVASDATSDVSGETEAGSKQDFASDSDHAGVAATSGQEVAEPDSNAETKAEVASAETGQTEVKPDANAGDETDPASSQDILINGELLDKLPDDLFIPPDALEIFLETFQGPLDLLLYLIRKQNLDILNIPVARITRQYMEYVELMRHFRLDLAAEYLVMAATLAEIKSRTLLPRPQLEEEGEEEDPRAALIRRLQEYERFSQAAQDIDTRPRMERELFLVKAEFEDPAPVKVEARASLNDIVVAFRSVMERTTNNKNWSVGHERLTVREKMTQILDRIRTKEGMRFEELFDPEEGRLGLVVSFMAVLELCRDSMLVVVQNEPFAPIHLKSIAGE